MALHDRIAGRAGSIGTRAELNPAECGTERASRLSKPFFQQKNKLLAKEIMQPKDIPDGVYGRHFLDVLLILPPLYTQCPSFCAIEDGWADRQA
jgi:hypothetical protein